MWNMKLEEASWLSAFDWNVEMVSSIFNLKAEWTSVMKLSEIKEVAASHTQKKKNSIFLYLLLGTFHLWEFFVLFFDEKRKKSCFEVCWLWIYAFQRHTKKNLTPIFLQLACTFFLSPPAFQWFRDSEITQLWLYHNFLTSFQISHSFVPSYSAIGHPVSQYLTSFLLSSFFILSLTTPSSPGLFLDMSVTLNAVVTMAMQRLVDHQEKARLRAERNNALSGN